MSNQIQNKNHTSLFNRAARALRKFGRDTRGVEMVEVLVVIVFFALGGMAAMKTLASGVDTASGKVEKKVSSTLGL